MDSDGGSMSGQRDLHFKPPVQNRAPLHLAALKKGEKPYQNEKEAAADQSPGGVMVDSRNEHRTFCGRAIRGWLNDEWRVKDSGEAQLREIEKFPSVRGCRFTTTPNDRSAIFFSKELLPLGWRRITDRSPGKRKTPALRGQCGREGNVLPGIFSPDRSLFRVRTISLARC